MKKKKTEQRRQQPKQNCLKNQHPQATLVDSLDTLWLMGFRKEFDRAKEWILSSLSFKPANGRQCGLSVFESTIRVLGGLLAAHDLSGETAFISKAEELARTLEPAYSTALFFPRSEIGENSFDEEKEKGDEEE